MVDPLVEIVFQIGPFGLLRTPHTWPSGWYTSFCNTWALLLELHAPTCRQLRPMKCVMKLWTWSVFIINSRDSAICTTLSMTPRFTRSYMWSSELAETFIPFSWSPLGVERESIQGRKTISCWDEDGWGCVLVVKHYIYFTETPSKSWQTWYLTSWSANLAFVHEASDVSCFGLVANKKIPFRCSA